MKQTKVYLKICDQVNPSTTQHKCWGLPLSINSRPRVQPRGSELTLSGPLQPARRTGLAAAEWVNKNLIKFVIPFSPLGQWVGEALASLFTRRLKSPLPRLAEALPFPRIDATRIGIFMNIHIIH